MPFNYQIPQCDATISPNQSSMYAWSMFGTRWRHHHIIHFQFFNFLHQFMINSHYQHENPKHVSEWHHNSTSKIDVYFLSFARCIIKNFMRGRVVTSSRSPSPLKTVSAFTQSFKLLWKRLFNFTLVFKHLLLLPPKQLKPPPLFHHKKFYRTQVDDVTRSLSL